MGPCTAKAVRSEKARRNWASVCGHSWLRCAMVTRLATVRCVRLSAVSGAGETVAALAAHMEEADMAAARIYASALPTSVPSAASHAPSGRHWGRNSPCASPRRRLDRIFSIPCNAAALGWDMAPELRAEARLPRLRPASLWLGPIKNGRAASRDRVCEYV